MDQYPDLGYAIRKFWTQLTVNHVGYFLPKKIKDVLVCVIVFSNKLKSHYFTKHHIEALAVHKIWQENKTIDRDTEEDIRQNENFWRKVLKRLSDITLTLARNSSSFRSHSKNVGDDYVDIFLAEVEWLAKYDNILKQVIDMPNGSVRYLSPKIQNELIECAGQNFGENLVTDINNSLCYSLLLDTTQDLTKKDQLNVMFRHIHILRNARLEY